MMGAPAADVTTTSSSTADNTTTTTPLLSPPPSAASLLTMDQRWSSDNIFISISGMIGAGKTTLADALSARMGLPVFHEPVEDNVYLADFYQDKERYGFPMQVYLLNRRFQQHQQIIWSGRGAVQDRTIYEDTVFAKVLMEEGSMETREYETYRSLFSNLSNFMQKPNLIVHLDVSPEESYRRISMRSRDCECGIPMEYLRRLHAAYEEFLVDIARIIPVIRVNYQRFRTAEEMADMVLREYATMTTVRHVDFDQQETAPKGKTVKAPPSKVVEAGKKESLTVASPLATATTTAAH